MPALGSGTFVLNAQGTPVPVEDALESGTFVLDAEGTPVPVEDALESGTFVLNAQGTPVLVEDVAGTPESTIEQTPEAGAVGGDQDATPEPEDDIASQQSAAIVNAVDALGGTSDASPEASPMSISGLPSTGATSSGDGPSAIIVAGALMAITLVVGALVLRGGLRRRA